jgi:hypothetical protein
MKRLLAAAALALLALPAYAQQTPVGQSPGGAISYGVYRENSDQIGFNDSAIALLTVPATSTTQETAPGTDGAINAPFTMLTNTNVVFRAVPTAANGVKWMQ